jgi:hypothetical protein
LLSNWASIVSECSVVVSSKISKSAFWRFKFSTSALSRWTSKSSCSVDGSSYIAIENGNF